MSLKNIIIGCIYRHPKASIEIFTDQLNELLRHLNQNKYQFYILGDINIDFFQYLNHQPTEKYLDMLHINNTAPLITKPTRITNHTKTLIDHIYTNTLTSQITSGIALYDISDHLPIFCVINTPIKRNKEKRFYRNFEHFNTESYLNDMRQIDWNDKCCNLNTNSNKNTQDIINIINEVTNKHAPIKAASQSN